MIFSPSVGPYTGVTTDKIFTCGSQKIRAICYHAFNAHGLIGTEYNGIALLDEDRKQVIVDEVEHAPSSYDSRLALAWAAKIEELSTMNKPQFRAWLAQQGRVRYDPFDNV